ncbi:MAG: hypothetical protein ACC656_00420 [Candidatus Heimdallarchaeota archaeon]
MSIVNNWKQDIINEIVDLHEFFQNWFNGTIPQNEFSRFIEAINTDFQIISPRGDLTNKSDLVAILKNGYARNNLIKIAVTDVNIKPISDDIFLAIYREIQTTGTETTSRISSAIFRRSNNLPNNYSWLHVHETWENTI